MLIVSDMDGTLLDANHQIPDEFWPLHEKMQAAGIHFAPASGRQLYTLLDQIPAESAIAENGTVVYHAGEIISTTTLPAEQAKAVIRTVEEADIDWGVVLCRVDGAFVSRTDNAFLREGIRYYKRLEHVEKLEDYVNDQVIKLAIFSFPEAEQVAPLLADSQLALAVSGAHWMDMMDPSANKGKGLRALAKHLGVDMADTVAFGDYLNDRELLLAAGTAWAMENAHPEIKAIADKIAPANTDHGVIKVLERYFSNFAATSGT